MSKSAIKNGIVISEDDALLPITVKEVQVGYSVYEALRVIDGRVVHLKEHITRLEESAKAIKLELGSHDYLSWINKLIESDNIKDASLRILVVGTKPESVFITYTDLLTYDDELYNEGIKVTTYKGERFMPTCKTSNLLLSYLALKDANEKNSFEALLVNDDNEVLEGTRSNFYAVLDNKVYTADDDKVLGGVTRISVLKALEIEGYEIVKRALKVDELEKATSMFISSTSMAAMPITMLDGKKVPCDISLVNRIKEYVRTHELD